MIEVRCDKNWKEMIDEKLLRKVLNIFIKELFFNEYRISIYVTGNSKIQKLNKEFRNDDKPTDILAWAYDENVSEIDRKVMIENGESIVGELVVSAELVLKQSIQNGWNFNTELFRLIAHGCAHLAGYNHEDSQKEADKMLELEIKLLKKIGLTKIY
tara:strand:- start:303 stop:773 length:471 start_codon:yes stop_codon:yes gene_type:complete